MERAAPGDAAGDGLLAWLHQALTLSPTAEVGDVTACAWFGGLAFPRPMKPAAITKRFRAAGCTPPRLLLAACRLATAGHLLALGLTVAEVAALYHTTPARLYRRLRLEPPAPPPYLAGRRLAARVAGEAPLFVARRALLPLLPPFDARCWRWPALLAREA